MKRALAVVTLLALTLPSVAFAQAEPHAEEAEFDPSHEWELSTWGPELKIGPIDMSINKAVAYLILGTIVSIVIGILFIRVRPGRGPNRRQALGESLGLRRLTYGWPTNRRSGSTRAYDRASGRTTSG